MSSSAIHRFTEPTRATVNVFNSVKVSESRRVEAVDSRPTVAFPSPPEIFKPRSGLTPKALYAQIAIAVLAGKRAQVECAGPWSLNKARCAVRARVQKHGHEMRSTKLGLTLWMELKA
jgi:hypothetical protein